MSRRLVSGSYSTTAGLPSTVAGNRPRSGSGSTPLLWTLLMIGGAVSERSASSLSSFISLAL